MSNETIEPIKNDENTQLENTSKKIYILIFVMIIVLYFLFKSENTDIFKNITDITNKLFFYIKKLEIFKNINVNIKGYQAFGIVSFFLYIFTILFIYIYNPLHIKDKYPIYTYITLIICLLFLIITFFYQRTDHNFNKEFINEEFINEDLNNKKFKNKINEKNGKYLILTDYSTSYIYQFIYILLAIIFIIFSIYSVSYIFGKTDFTLIGIETLISKILTFSIIIGILAIIYKSLNIDTENNDVKPTTITLFLNLLKNVIFYIPCLFIDLIELIKHEYKITKKTELIILFIEIVLISLYFLIPYLLNLFRDSNKLLNDCVYLNNKKTIGTFQNLHEINENLNNTKEEIENSKFKYEYSISGWFYINPQPPNTNPSYNKYTNILNYGNKPIIEYKGSINSLRIKCEINNDYQQILYETNNIPLQKWNNIVINYDHGIMDIFINGNLVNSTNELVPYMKYENIIIGNENGIHGGICNIQYNTKLMSKSSIETNYKLLRDKMKPIFF